MTDTNRLTASVDTTGPTNRRRSKRTPAGSKWIHTHEKACEFVATHRDRNPVADSDTEAVVNIHSLLFPVATSNDDVRPNTIDYSLRITHVIPIYTTTNITTTIR